MLVGLGTLAARQEAEGAVERAQRLMKECEAVAALAQKISAEPRTEVAAFNEATVRQLVLACVMRRGGLSNNADGQ